MATLRPDVILCLKERDSQYPFPCKHTYISIGISLFTDPCKSYSVMGVEASLLEAAQLSATVCEHSRPFVLNTMVDTIIGITCVSQKNFAYCAFGFVGWIRFDGNMIYKPRCKRK